MPVREIRGGRVTEDISPGRDSGTVIRFVRGSELTIEVRVRPP
jgi:hypothetical protein